MSSENTPRVVIEEPARVDGVQDDESVGKLRRVLSPYSMEEAVQSTSAIDLSTPPPAGTDHPSLAHYRRKSGIDIDAIHDNPEQNMAPAQLYLTESGHLFHAGKIVVVTVGLPARGKTHISVALSRYLRWLGVKCRAFHLGDYRRKVVGPGKDVPEDYFFVEGKRADGQLDSITNSSGEGANFNGVASPSTVLLRKQIIKECRDDIYRFLQEEGGQVVIYDAVNPLSSGRKGLEKEFTSKGYQTLFIESYCNDHRIIEENVRNVKITSPDYAGWDPMDAVKDYLARINAKIPHFETMTEKDLNYIKMIDAGDRIEVNNCKRIGYLLNRIVFYLMNLHIKTHKTYFARAGPSTKESSYKADASLSEEGQAYAKRLYTSMVNHRAKEREQFIAQGGAPSSVKPLTIWTSTRRRTIETAGCFMEEYKIRQRPQLSQLNPGAVEALSDEEIEKRHPEEFAKHLEDPYHHRYSRAESYHDLAVRLEPIILELEREKSDLLIIAHESVLRVLYGYLMATNTIDIPFLDFGRNEIVEIIPGSYNNMAKRIPIE